MRSKTIRALSVALLVNLLPQVGDAGTPIDIEAMQREFQARFNYLTEGNYIIWPQCNCQAAPLFPPEKFYGDLDKDPEFAADLVQHLADQFFADDLAVYRTPLYTSISGATWFDGLYNDPFYSFWINTNVTIEGQFDMPPNYTDADFPVTGSGFDFNNITTSNYTNCAIKLRQYIEKLNCVSAGSFASLTFVDTNQAPQDCGSGYTTNAPATCDAAKSQAAYHWAWTSPCGGPPWVLTSTSSQTDSGGAVTYNVEKSAVRSRPYCNPSWIPGTLKFYLSATNYPGCSSPGPTNNWAVTNDGKWHLFWTVATDGTNTFYGPHIADVNPAVDATCSGGTQGWVLGPQGSPISGIFGIFYPAFDFDADHVPVCGGGSPGSFPTGSGGSCGANCITPGAVTADTGGMDVRINLGPGLYGNSAGYVYFHADTASAALYTPDCWRLALASGSFTIIDYGLNLIQINTPNVTAYVVTNAAGCAILFTNPASQLVASVTVSNNANINQMFITEVLGSNGAPHVIEFDYSAVTGTWTKKEGNGFNNTLCTTVWTTPTNRTDTIVLSNNNATATMQITNQYRLFPWGSTLVQQTLGTGSSAKTTTWTYYEDSSDTNNYGQLQQVVEPTGRWERYQYDSAGRLLTKLAQFGDNGINTNSTLNRTTQVSYNDISGIITTVEKLLNTEVSRTYQIMFPPQYGVQEIQTIRCAVAGATINNAANLTNILWRTTDTFTTGNAWDPVQELHPDGTMTFYTYTTSEGQKTTVVTTGTADTTQTYITDGTQTTTVVGQWGQILFREVQDIASGRSVLDQDTYTYTDDLCRSHTVTHLDGRTETFNYACCGLGTYTDRDGTSTQYTYDAAKRQTAATRLYITTSNVLDAAGNSLASIRFGTSGSPITLRQAAYDFGGKLTSKTNALNGVTTYAQSTNASGQTVTTVTYPDGGTRVETYYQDASLLSVGGTAAHPVQYLYGVDSDGPYTTEIKVTSSGGTNEWVKTSTDMLGRAYKTIYAPGSASFVSHYNTLGQLTNQVDPDGVITLYAYNAKGEQVYSILDSNRNYTIDFDGADRITFTTNDVTSDHSTTVRRTRTYVWATANSGDATLVSTVENSVDGLQSWQTQYRDADTPVTTHSQTTYGGSGSGSRTVTVTAPDNSSTESAYSYGRLSSVTHYDSTPTQIGKTTYGYDTHGRQSTVTDARNGTTTYALNNADLVTSVTTPNPGTLASAAQTTLTYYNTMLQATNVVQPDGTSVSSEFYHTGELKRQYGSRTYPVGYGYDYAGRMSTMTNWSSFPSAGARVTTWNYDPYRGWLGSKTYDGSVAGPIYTNTLAGRLALRVWARGTNTIYSYNNAGDLSGVSYSDGSPGVAYTYDRRGRQASVTQNGITTSLAYNTANELLGESYSGGLLSGLAVTNTYDGYLRRATLAVKNSGTAILQHAFGYDGASRLQSVTDNSGATAYSATYSYLANSPLVSQILFKQSTTTRMTTTKQYDYLNRLLSISSAPSAGSAVSFSYLHNTANQRIRSTLADGSYWLYSFDSLGQVIAGNKYWVDGTPVAGQQFDYSFDTIGNRTATLAGGDQNGANLRSAAYGANSLNQYTNRTVPGAVDVMGLALGTNSVTVNGSTPYRKGEYFRQQLSVANSSTAVWQSVTNAAPNETTITGNVWVPKTPEPFGYDADGNLTSDGRWTYGWDAENRLVSLTTNTTVGPQLSIKFEYDWKGRRIHKQVWDNTSWSGTPTNDVKFVYDGWNLLDELNATNNAVIRSYMWGSDLSGSLQGAGGVGGLLEVTYNGTQTTNCFVAYDGNGNVAALVDVASTNVLAQYAYGPFGEVIRATGPMAKANLIRFSTKYQDDESDLLYYGYRYYSASTGRWLSRDPIGEQGFSLLSGRSKKRLIPEFNPYGFVNNAPVDNYDYLGLTGTGSGGASCAISPYNSGRVSFRGFSPDKLAEFRLIAEDQTDGGTPDSSGRSSDRVDGFWWKGIKTHWYKLPDFCWAIVEPEFSEDGFSVKWCCHDCTRLLCQLSTIFKDRPCTPGFVPNSGNTRIGKYPFED